MQDILKNGMQDGMFGNYIEDVDSLAAMGRYTCYGCKVITNDNTICFV